MFEKLIEANVTNKKKKKNFVNLVGLVWNIYNSTSKSWEKLMKRQSHDLHMGIEMEDMYDLSKKIMKNKVL